MQIRPHSLRQAFSLQRLSAPCAGIPARCVSSATPEGQSNAAAARGSPPQTGTLAWLAFRVLQACMRTTYGHVPLLHTHSALNFISPEFCCWLQRARLKLSLWSLHPALRTPLG